MPSETTQILTILLVFGIRLLGREHLWPTFPGPSRLLWQGLGQSVGTTAILYVTAILLETIVRLAILKSPFPPPDPDKDSLWFAFIYQMQYCLALPILREVIPYLQRIIKDDGDAFKCGLWGYIVFWVEIKLGILPWRFV